MRAVVQRVSEASVTVNGKLHEEINNGLLVLLGIEHEDNMEDCDYLSAKIAGMRIFPDNERKMNLSVTDIDGEILVISQFTLHALTKKGNRPSFLKSAQPDKAMPLYNSFIAVLSRLTNKKVKSGIFGAMMNVSLINSGPVTILLDSKNKE